MPAALTLRFLRKLTFLDSKCCFIQDFFVKTAKNALKLYTRLRMAVRGLFPVLLCVGWTSAGREDCYGFLGVAKKEANKKIKSAYR